MKEIGGSQAVIMAACMVRGWPALPLLLSSGAVPLGQWVLLQEAVGHEQILAGLRALWGPAGLLLEVKSPKAVGVPKHPAMELGAASGPPQ